MTTPDPPRDYTTGRVGHSHTMTKKMITTALLLCLTGCTFTTDEAQDGTVVERVVDGDTIEVSGVGTVRLIGVDTPETKHPDKGVECFGPEASAYLTELLPVGTVVTLEQDAEPKDDYDRLLAYVYTPDGVLVNAELVKSGHARTLSIEPNTLHADELSALEADAQGGGVGMWGTCP